MMVRGVVVCNRLCTALVAFIFSQITVALIHAKERAELFIIAVRSYLVEVLLLGNGGALVQG